ncbi:unnamed protein product [Calypogeia fissa]
MANSTSSHRGNSTMALSTPTPSSTSFGHCDAHRQVLQAQGLAHSTPSNTQMAQATSRVYKSEDYDKTVQYLEIPENSTKICNSGLLYKKSY